MARSLRKMVYAVVLKRYVINDENNIHCKISDTGFLFSIDSPECSKEVDRDVLPFVTLGHAFKQCTVLWRIYVHILESRKDGHSSKSQEILGSAADALLLYL